MKLISRYFHVLFIDQKITEKIFPVLDKETIRELIPLAGERLLFNTKFKTEVQKAEVIILKLYKYNLN